MNTYIRFIDVGRSVEQGEEMFAEYFLSLLLLYRNVCPESSYGGLPAMREEEDRRKCFVLILPPYLFPLYQRKS